MHAATRMEATTAEPTPAFAKTCSRWEVTLTLTLTLPLTLTLTLTLTLVLDDKNGATEWETRH